MSQFDFKGKAAMVTGANRGIGEAYVRELLNRGVDKVYAAVRNLENAQFLVNEYGEKVEPVLLDITKPEHIKAVATKMTKLDILINNAGIINPCLCSSDQALDIARLEMETNFFGPVNLTTSLLPLLKQSTAAVIINVSSIAGISNFPAIGLYSATKAAMHSYTQGLRADLAAEQITVIGVYPGPIDTRMTEGWEMDKPAPSQVAIRSFDALQNGEVDVMPDDFSEQMYAAFLSHPHELEKAFAQMQ